MPEENDDQQVEQEAEFKAITSQEELDKLIGARIHKVKSQFSDYDDLKEKASKLADLEEANKTELQKAQDRIKELEGATARAERAALVQRIATEEGVIPEVLHGDTEEEMRATAARVKEWANHGKKPAPKSTTLASGSSGEPKTGEKGRAAAALRNLRKG